MLYVGFNTVSGPCASAAVRQALLRAFDRSSAVTARLSRHAQAAALPVSPVSPLYDAELAQSLAYDTGAAEELLTQAGYSRSDGVWQRRGTPLSLTLAAPTNNPTRLDAAELLVANLTDLGIQAELSALSWTTMSRPWRRGISTCTWGRCASPPTSTSPPSSPRRGAELRRVQQCPDHQPAQRLPGRLRHGQDGGGGPALRPAGPGAALRGDLLQELVGADAVESALRPDPHPAEPVLPV